MGAASVTLAASAPKDLVLKGDAKCTTCHDEGDSPKVLAIGKTKHGNIADKRVGTCTSCHGDSDKHIADAEKGTKPPTRPDVTYSAKGGTSIESKNGACLTCHQGGNRVNCNRLESRRDGKGKGHALFRLADTGRTDRECLGAGGGNRTPTVLRPQDFKSRASTSFATPAAAAPA